MPQPQCSTGGCCYCESTAWMPPGAGFALTACGVFSLRGRPPLLLRWRARSCHYNVCVPGMGQALVRWGLQMHRVARSGMDTRTRRAPECPRLSHAQLWRNECDRIHRHVRYLHSSLAHVASCPYILPKHTPAPIRLRLQPFEHRTQNIISDDTVPYLP